MKYLITRHEAQALLNIERSMTYILVERGLLPKPQSGFGKNKLFDLEQILIFFHDFNGWPPPNQLTVESHWRTIYFSRINRP